MPFSDSNVPFAKHNLHLNTQTKLNPPKEQSVQKRQATHSTLQMQNNWTHEEENKQGRQPEHDAWLRQQRWSSGCITEVHEVLHKHSPGRAVPCTTPEPLWETPGIPAASCPYRASLLWHQSTFLNMMHACRAAVSPDCLESSEYTLGPC